MFEEARKGYSTIPGLRNVLLVLDFSCSAKWPPSGLSPHLWQQYHYILPQGFSDPNVHRSTWLQGLAPKDSDAASLKWGPRICILMSLPGESGATVLKTSQEGAPMQPSADRKLERSFLVIDRATLHCHHWLVLLEVGRTKKEGKWRRDKVGCWVPQRQRLRLRQESCAVILKGVLSGERGRGKPVRRREGTNQGGVPLQSSSSEIPHGAQSVNHPTELVPP